MKLIYCPECHDVIRLLFDRRTCKCGKSGGMYRNDGLNAIVDGNAIPIGFDNISFEEAIVNRPMSGDGELFCAFVIPRMCRTVEKY